MVAVDMKLVIFGLLCVVEMVKSRTCVSQFDDIRSRALASDFVLVGKVQSLKRPVNGFYNATIRLVKVFKKASELPKKRTITVAGFSSRLSAELCTAPVDTGKSYILFLASDPLDSSGVFRLARLPSKSSGKNIKNIKRILCKKKCAKAPNIKKIGEVKVKKGKKIVIKCRVSANPPPKITWTKDGEPLKKRQGLKIRANKKGTLSVVRVKKASPKDAGVYTCRAINLLGASAKNVSVTVLLPQPTTTTPASTTIFKKEHWVSCAEQTYCFNGGQCAIIPRLNERLCQCPSSFTGERCEENVVDFRPVLPGLERPKNVIAMGVAMGIIIGVLLFIVMIMCFLYNRKQRGRQNNYNIANHELPLLDQVDSRPPQSRPMPYPGVQKTTEAVPDPNHHPSSVMKGTAISNEERHQVNSVTSFGSRLPSRKRLSGVSKASSGSSEKGLEKDPSGAHTDDTNNSLPSQSSNTESCQPVPGSDGSSMGSHHSVNESVIGNTVTISNKSLYDNDHSGQYPKQAPATNRKSNHESPAKKAEVSIFFDEEQLLKNGILLDRETNI